MRKVINGDVDLSFLNLTKLFDLSDVEVTKGDFFCENNSLINLTGSPHTVNGNFWCDENNLTSLSGGPHTVKYSFHCESNNLTSLEGAPKIINEDFNCRSNKLTNIKGLPETIGGDLVLDGYLEAEFSEEYIRSRCKIKGEIYYYDEDEDDVGDGEGWW